MGYPAQTCPCARGTGSRYPRHGSEARKALLSEGQLNEKAGGHSQNCLALLSRRTAYMIGEGGEYRRRGFLETSSGGGGGGA